MAWTNRKNDKKPLR